MSGAGLNVLVYPHAMEVGGSQLNAIELAAAVRDLGNEVTVLSDDGPLVQRVRELDLMADLMSLLSKRAAGREISGLSAYEQ